MEPSSTYIAVRNMIQYGLLVVIFPQFAQTLALLKEKGLITEVEHEGLLQLGEQMQSDVYIQ